MSPKAERKGPTVWEDVWSSLATDEGAPWDTDPLQTVSWCPDLASFVEPDLPVVDLGCGSGLHTWWLAELLAGAVPAVVGVDISETAVKLARSRRRAQAETLPDVRFEVADITDRGAIDRLATRIGPANVWVRLVLHALPDDESRRGAVEHARLLAGEQGSIINLELVRQEIPMKRRNPHLARLFPDSSPPGRIEPGALGALYRDRGLTVIAQGRDTEYVPHGLETPLKCEWVVAREGARKAT